MPALVEPAPIAPQDAPGVRRSVAPRPCACGCGVEIQASSHWPYRPECAQRLGLKRGASS